MLKCSKDGIMISAHFSANYRQRRVSQLTACVCDLASFHWLRAPERVQFKLATIVHRSLNVTAPSYLAAELRRLSDKPSRRRLRSSLTHQLDVPHSQCSTVGDRAFAVADERLWWNSLPLDIVACDTLSRFRRELKTFLFRQSSCVFSLS